MKYIMIVGLLIAFTVTALFVIDKSDFLLISAIVIIIAGFWFAVFQIPKEEEGDS